MNIFYALSHSLHERKTDLLDFFKSKFFRKTLDAVHRWQGEPFVMNSDGKISKAGYIGRCLDGVDKARVAEVVHKMSRSPAGAALLAYATEKNVDIGYPRKMPADTGATYETRSGVKVKGDIHLNTSLETDYLVSALAHEIRHAWQHERIGKLFGNNRLPPRAVIAINRLIEADAYLFQTNFCTDYAEQAQDDGPLQSLARRYESGMRDIFLSSSDDEERFLKMAAYLKNSSYDRVCEDEILISLNDRDASIKGGYSLPKNAIKMMSPHIVDKLVISAACAMDNTWPLDRHGKTNYLTREGGQMHLKSAGRILSDGISGSNSSKVEKAATRYSAHYAAQKGSALLTPTPRQKK